VHHRPLTDAPKEIAKGIGITSLLFAVSMYLPLMGFLCSFLIPLPILFYRAKLGRHLSGILILGTLLVISMIVGKISFDVVFFAHLLLLGFFLGEVFDMKLSVEKTIAYPCCALWATSVISLFFFSLITGDQITVLVSDFVSKNLETTLQLYEEMGVPPETIQMLRDSLETIRYALVRVIPGFLAGMTLLIVWSTLLLAKPVFAAGHLSFPSFGPLKFWKAPDFLVWVSIGCGVALLFPYQGVKLLAINGLFVLMTIYFFQGIAIVSWFFEKKDFPRLLRIIFYCFIAIQQLMILLLIGVGFFDMWLNFRKLKNSDHNS
jgi:uncharacterized protein YybS (DUF2232 family)